MNTNSKIKISAPGRLCLFGEHQDYLNLPVIAAAISKRIFIEGSKRNDTNVLIDLPDISQTESFDINEEIIYSKERDYFKSSINVLLRNGYTFSKGIECTVHGEIPVNAGASSSSALIVAWINLLTRLSDQSEILDQKRIAELAYEAEVLEFTEPGGMMDHYSTAVGDIIWLESFPKIKLESINAKLGAFVLGNSREPKDTKDILARVKYGVLNIVESIQKKNPGFSLQHADVSDVNKFRDDLTEDQYNLMVGTIRNRKITLLAKKELTSENIDHEKIGRLLNNHHKLLRDVQKISTPKIDSMIDAALETGACGAKINGSGGGGCMFAYAPENTEKVLEAVRKISGEAYIVHVDKGTSEELVGVK